MAEHVTVDITKADRDTLIHMLGAGSHIRRGARGHRNYFAAGESQVADMERLVEAGLVTRGVACYGLVYYHATEAGCDAAGLSKAAKRRAFGGA